MLVEALRTKKRTKFDCSRNKQQRTAECHSPKILLLLYSYIPRTYTYYKSVIILIRSTYTSIRRRMYIKKKKKVCTRQVSYCVSHGSNDQGWGVTARDRQMSQRSRRAAAVSKLNLIVLLTARIGHGVFVQNYRQVTR